MAGSGNTNPMPETFAQQTKGLLTESGEWATDPPQAARGFSVPGADGLTEEEAREAVENAEKSVQESLEKIEKIKAMIDDLPGPETPIVLDEDPDLRMKAIRSYAKSLEGTADEPKKLEPVRYVSAFIVLLTALLNTLNLMGWTSFTVVEQTAIIGGATAIANEVARMHVTAPPKT